MACKLWGCGSFTVWRLSLAVLGTSSEGRGNCSSCNGKPGAVRACALHRQLKCTSINPGSRGVDDVEESSRAVWWPASNGSQRQDSRTFSGEIRLAKTLKPTSAISHFTLKNQYFVVLLPFEVTGFSSADTQPLIRQEVQIATIFATVRLAS
ncbi:hypothetical protein B0H19DRAFT_1318192 [Mycena capillaripes]|nr:hypothetical protein B0H19DRAFT_1318192 [Mycena capillaripes]